MKLIFKLLLSYFPTPLPVGMPEFQQWSDDILELSKVPDNDSTRFAVAVMILHLNPDTDRISKRSMIKRLNKSASNEVANAVAQGLKEKQQAAVKLEAQRKAEANGLNGSTQTGAPNDNVVQN